MFLILFVLHDPGLCDDIFEAWEEAGVGGITIFPSTGLARIRTRGAWRDDIPLLPSLEDFKSHIENMNRTLITIVDDEAMADRVVAATQSVTGDLNQPNTGILVVLPIVRSYGLNRMLDDGQ